jgi:hypothetical protein
MALLPIDLNEVERSAKNLVVSETRRFLNPSYQHVAQPDEVAIGKNCFLHDEGYTSSTLRMSAADRRSISAAHEAAKSIAMRRVGLENAAFQLRQQETFLNDAADARLRMANHRRANGPASGLETIILATWPEYSNARRRVAHNRAVLNAREAVLSAEIDRFTATLVDAHNRMVAAWQLVPAAATPLEIVAELEAYRQNHLRDCLRLVTNDRRLDAGRLAAADQALEGLVRERVAFHRAKLNQDIRSAATRGQLDYLLGRLNRTPLLRSALAAEPVLIVSTREAQTRFDAIEASERAAAEQASAAERRRQELARHEEARERVRTNPEPTVSQLQEYLAAAHFEAVRKRGQQGLERSGHAEYSVKRTVPLLNIPVEATFRFEVDQLRCSRQTSGHRCDITYSVHTRSNMAVANLGWVDRESLTATLRWSETGLVSADGDAFVARRTDRLIAAHEARVERNRERQACIDQSFSRRWNESYSSARRRAESSCN